MRRLSRPTALKIAAMLSFLAGVHGLVLFMPLMARGAAAIHQATGWLPYYVIILVFVQSVIRITTAYLVWNGQRAGVIWTLVVDGFDLFDSVPGMLFAPTSHLWIGSIAETICGMIVIVLCLWRER